MESSYKMDFRDPRIHGQPGLDGLFYEGCRPSNVPQSHVSQTHVPQTHVPQTHGPQTHVPQSVKCDDRDSMGLPASPDNMNGATDYEYGRRVHTEFYDRDSKPLGYHYVGRGPETYDEYKRKLRVKMGRDWIKPDVTGRKSQHQQSPGYPNIHGYHHSQGHAMPPPRSHDNLTLDDQQSPIIERMEWGYVRIKGAPGDYGDVQLGPKGCRDWDWTEHGTHHEPGVAVNDANTLLLQNIQVLVICTGYEGRLQVPRRTKDFIRKSAELYCERPQRAVEIYNDFARKGVRVGALIHSTC